MLEEFGADYRQILSLSAPPIESINPDRADHARSRARSRTTRRPSSCGSIPHRFPGFIASLPLNHPEESVAELERARDRARRARRAGLLERQRRCRSTTSGSSRCSRRRTACAARSCCIRRAAPAFADYPGETKSKYEIWWTFGWPYETSAAMQRLVFSRLFDRLPAIQIVAHHLGAMIPYFEGRVGYGLDQFGARTADEDYDGAAARRCRSGRYDYFKMFWADTAVFGSRAATECGLKFFGADQVVFASDAPFDPEGGPMYIRETIHVIDRVWTSAPGRDRHKIYQGNAGARSSIAALLYGRTPQPHRSASARWNPVLAAGTPA